MFALITGGSGSGKSEYAEGLAVKLAGREHLPLYYIATMEPLGEEGRRRVERHRKLRAGKGFRTIERYRDLKGLNQGEMVLPEESVVLLECLSNLTANEMFGEDKAADVEQEVLLGVETVSLGCRHLVAVTNDIFSDGAAYDETTTQYQRCLAGINAVLATRADLVTEVVCAIPLHRKGDVHGTTVEQL